MECVLALGLQPKGAGKPLHSREKQALLRGPTVSRPLTFQRLSEVMAKANVREGGSKCYARECGRGGEGLQFS